MGNSLSTDGGSASKGRGAQPAETAGLPHVCACVSGGGRESGQV